MILTLNNVNKFYNGNQILKNINLTIENNDRIGLIGVNGCGKSTLLKIIRITSYNVCYTKLLRVSLSSFS